MKLSHQQALIALIFLAAGILLGYALFSKSSPISSITGASELHDNSDSAQYPHISPLLICNNTENLTNDDLLNTKQLVQEYVDNKKKDGTLTDAGIYFLDLNNGPWFGIDQDKEFSPGSLLKVPLLLSYYKIAENDPTALAKEVQYAGGDAGADQFEQPAEKIQVGMTYTIDDLLKRMVNFSDNDAALLLYEVMDKNQVDGSFKDLGLTAPDPKVDYSISVHDYAAFFRVLYNATYLSQEYSEKALVLLTNGTFDKGLVAGVPSGIQVAHKFGERTYSNDTNQKQLHDCGIIYAPNHPYLLCVMTKGTDFPKLEDTIKNISDIVYRRVTT